MAQGRGLGRVLVLLGILVGVSALGILTTLHTPRPSAPPPAPQVPPGPPQVSPAPPAPAASAPDASARIPEQRTDPGAVFPQAGTPRPEGPPSPEKRALALLKEGERFRRSGDRRKALAAFQEALRLAPGLAEAHRHLAELFYEADDVEQAIRHWERYVSLRPQDRRAAQQLARARREAGVHQGLLREATRHFAVKFDGRADDGARRDVLRILEDAYREVGNALGHHPSREIVVILYTQQQFRDITRSPSWAGALFDGKIRIPVEGYRHRMSDLRRVLYHEYTHALIRDLAKSCPAWLNEGLAQYFEAPSSGDREDAALRSLVQSGRLIPLKALTGSFVGFNAFQAQLAYAQSASVTRYLVRRYGMGRIRRFLELLRERRSLEEAMDWAFALDLERLDRRWRESLAGG